MRVKTDQCHQLYISLTNHHTFLRGKPYLHFFAIIKENKLQRIT